MAEVRSHATIRHGHAPVRGHAVVHSPIHHAPVHWPPVHRPLVHKPAPYNPPTYKRAALNAPRTYKEPAYGVNFGRKANMGATKCYKIVLQKRLRYSWRIPCSPSRLPHPSCKIRDCWRLLRQYHGGDIWRNSLLWNIQTTTPTNIQSSSCLQARPSLSCLNAWMFDFMFKYSIYWPYLWYGK